MKQIIVILAMMLSLSSIVRADDSRHVGIYILNFARNIAWNNSDSNDKFVITIVGDERVAIGLDKALSGKLIGNRPIEIKSVNKVQNIEKNVHTDIVYVSEVESRNISAIYSQFKNQQTLIVAGKRGMCPHGAVISLYKQNEKVEFELSDKNLAMHNIRMSARMRDNAILVE